MITLEEMKVGMSDKVSQTVVDTFIRNSELLELLPFDDAVSPQGGSTLTYGYIQTKLPSTTAFRAIGSDYTPSEAVREKKTVDLKIFGGSFSIDRVIAEASGKFNNVAVQMEEKIKSAIGTFHNALINGDHLVDSNSFDGLDAFLVGQSTEINTGSYIDLSNMTNLKSNADAFYEMLTDLITMTNADAIFVNSGMKTKIQTVARILGYKTESEEAFGRKVTNIDGVRIIDLKNIVTVNEDSNTHVKTAVETPIIGKNTRTIGAGESAASVSNLTDIYAAHFSVDDGLCGVTLDGGKTISQHLPDFTKAGTVKTGDVEMVAAIALKNIKSAGVLRNIKI